MANVTDPLAAALHGTDPQNLLEYITRQKIYDCRFWKEECFGLTAVNVLEKATSLTCVGASFGGNRQPTKFLCLVLKLLQIQPPDDLVDEFIATEDFKYVRALGAFYKRLTGRPADIYEKLEPLYNDYRKLRYRDINEWKLIHMDDFCHSLLRDERVCGIALPRLPLRSVLEQEGYLDGPRTSALSDVLENKTARDYLQLKVQEGSVPAKELWESMQSEKKKSSSLASAAQVGGGASDDDEKTKIVGEEKKRSADYRDDKSSRKRSKKEKKNYGTLFKSDNKSEASATTGNTETSSAGAPPEEGSEEYWNEQRKKLGLKPLKK